MTEKRDIESLVDEAIELGWTVERAEGGALRFFPPKDRAQPNLRVTPPEDER